MRTEETRLPVLVGECNHYGPDPRRALHCFPPTSSGGRLQRAIMALSVREYLGFPRYNLCTRLWDLQVARVTAQQVRERHAGQTLVLLGSKVCSAFRLPYEPFTVRPATLYSPRAVILPHPSGRCRAWNDPNALLTARIVLKQEFPGVPFGSLEAHGEDRDAATYDVVLRKGGVEVCRGTLFKAISRQSIAEGLRFVRLVLRDVVAAHPRDVPLDEVTSVYELALLGGRTTAVGEVLVVRQGEWSTGDRCATASVEVAFHTRDSEEDGDERRLLPDQHGAAVLRGHDAANREEPG